LMKSISYLAPVMNWLTRFLRKDTGRADAPSVHSIQFDTSCWKSKKMIDNRLEWRNNDGDTLCITFFAHPNEFLHDLSNLKSLRESYRREAAKSDGAIITVEVAPIAGIASIKVINKFERLPAYAYEGTLVLPFRNFYYTIIVHSIERGTTGVRDAVVSAHLAERGELEIELFEKSDASDATGRIKGWFYDPYDSSYQGRTLHSMSDDERFDALFPHHPLSKIRGFLNAIERTLTFDRTIRRDDYWKSTSSIVGGLVVPTTIKESGIRKYALSSATVGTLYGKAGRFAEAESILKDSIATCEKSYDAKHPETAAITVDLAHVYIHQGRFDEAEKLLKRALNIREQAYGQDHSEVAKSLLLLGLVYDAQGKYIDAEPILLRARTIFEASFGAQHPTTAQAINNLARVYISQGKHAEAEPLFRQALRVFEKEDPSRTSNAAIALNGLGLVCNQREHYSAAIPLFRRALEIFEKVHGPEFPDVATVLRNMAFSFHKLGDDREAKKLLARAEGISHK